MIVLAVLLQATPATAPVTRATAAPPTRFSILLDDCPTGQGRDVVVCAGRDATGQRLPLPDDAEPTVGYVKPDSMDYRDNKGDRHPCIVRGCQVGFGPPIMPVIAAAVGGVSNALKDRREAKARARDGDRRRPIDLSDAPTGRVEP